MTNSNVINDTTQSNKKSSPPTLSALTDRLEASLTTNPDAEMLSEQAALLDQIFGIIVDEQIAPRLAKQTNYPEDVQGWLVFALKAQKQCADTLKARAAMEYMASLNTKALPPPANPAKRTEEKP